MKEKKYIFSYNFIINDFTVKTLYMKGSVPNRYFTQVLADICALKLSYMINFKDENKMNNGIACRQEIPTWPLTHLCFNVWKF